MVELQSNNHLKHISSFLQPHPNQKEIFIAAIAQRFVFHFLNKLGHQCMSILTVGYVLWIYLIPMYGKQICL